MLHDAMWVTFTETRCMNPPEVGPPDRGYGVVELSSERCCAALGPCI